MSRERYEHIGDDSWWQIESHNLQPFMGSGVHQCFVYLSKSSIIGKIGSFKRRPWKSLKCSDCETGWATKELRVGEVLGERYHIHGEVILILREHL